MALGLTLLSACQQQNIQPAATNNASTEAIVIDLDLTQSPAVTTVAKIQADSDVQKQSHTTTTTMATTTPRSKGSSVAS